MLSRARRTLPGVMVSLMLAAPGLSTPVLADPVTPPAGAPAARTAKAVKPATRHAAVRKRAPRHATHVAQADAGGHVVLAAWRVPAGGASWSQSGLASWYGGAKWQGRRTASGERYDEHALTAAHAYLPIGSKVRVTVADTGRSVIVTINDRPGTRKRIIDLSRGAAEALGILHRGIAQVTLQTT